MHVGRGPDGTKLPTVTIAAEVKITAARGTPSHAAETALANVAQKLCGR